MLPERTPATTSALRRITQRLVLGGGRSATVRPPNARPEGTRWGGIDMLSVPAERIFCDGYDIVAECGSASLNKPLKHEMGDPFHTFTPDPNRRATRSPGPRCWPGPRCCRDAD